MKTKEELNELKEEVKNLNEKLRELTEEELAEVCGGYKFDFDHDYFPNHSPNHIPDYGIQKNEFPGNTSSGSGGAVSVH